MWKSAVLNLFKNWRIVTQSDNALSDHGIDLLASKSTQNQNEEYAQPIVNYEPLQFKFDSGAEVNVLTRNYLNKVILKTQRSSKLKLSNATF